MKQWIEIAAESDCFVLRKFAEHLDIVANYAFTNGGLLCTPAVQAEFRTPFREANVALSEKRFWSCVDWAVRDLARSWHARHYETFVEGTFRNLVPITTADSAMRAARYLYEFEKWEDPGFDLARYAANSAVSFAHEKDHAAKAEHMHDAVRAVLSVASGAAKPKQILTFFKSLCTMC